MNWMTPIRVAKALPSKERRAAYVARLRTDVWNVLARLPFEIDVTVSFRGDLRLSLHNRDVALAPAIFATGCFEESELQFICSKVSAGMVTVDVGANIGVHTVVMAQRVGSSGTVHAFEPSAAYERLTRNVELNSFSDRVVLNRCAVGRDVGTISLTMCKPGFEAYTSINSPFLETASTGETFTSHLLTLDNYAEIHKIAQIDFLKIDAEGAELDVLAGARYLLKNRRIHCLLMEVNPTCLLRSGSSPEGLLREIQQMGFCTYMLGQDANTVSIDSAALKGSINVVCLPGGRMHNDS